MKLNYFFNEKSIKNISDKISNRYTRLEKTTDCKIDLILRTTIMDLTDLEDVHFI